MEGALILIAVVIAAAFVVPLERRRGMAQRGALTA